MHKNKALIAPLGLVGITILSGVFLMSSYSYATSDNTDIVDEINITVPISCTMSGTGMTSHTANMSNGSYTPNIGTTTLKVFCNDEEGFAIFAAGYTGDEIGGTNSTKLVNSASQVNNTISTGTATSGSTSNWAMKLATNSGATYAVTLDNGFGSYSSVPSSYTKVAHRDSGTDIGTTATGAELTTTYAAFVNQTQPAGTYIGKVIYTLVHPASEEPPHEVACEAGKICYNPNTTTALGEMGKQTTRDIYGNNTSGSITDYSTVTLWASNYKRDGFGFAGWNTKYDYTGINFGPNQTIAVPGNISTNGLSLYAVWIKTAGTIQDWDGCSSMNIGDITALTDNRDNNTYAVAKLADNKCWMIENLRLDNMPELSFDSTHNPSLPLINNYASSITSNHLSNPIDLAQEAWCTTDSADCSNQSRLTIDNTTLFTSNTSSNYNTSSNVYSYGNYYNWYSATAGHGKYGSGYEEGFVSPGDICPSGWHLPTGGVTGEFSTLDTAIGGTGVAQYTSEATNRWRAHPNNFVYSGYIYGTSIFGRSSEGGCWSPNADNYNYANYLNYYIRNVYPTSGSYLFPGVGAMAKRNNGETIRCISDI